MAGRAASRSLPTAPQRGLPGRGRHLGAGVAPTAPHRAHRAPPRPPRPTAPHRPPGDHRAPPRPIAPHRAPPRPRPPPSAPPHRAPSISTAPHRAPSRTIAHHRSPRAPPLAISLHIALHRYPSPPALFSTASRRSAPHSTAPHRTLRSSSLDFTPTRPLCSLSFVIAPHAPHRPYSVLRSTLLSSLHFSYSSIARLMRVSLPLAFFSLRTNMPIHRSALGERDPQVAYGIRIVTAGRAHARPWPAGASWPGAAPGGPRPGRGPADVRLAEHGLYLLEALALDFLDRPPGPPTPLRPWGRASWGRPSWTSCPGLQAMVTAGAAAYPPGGLVGLTLGLLRAHMQVSALVEAACGLLAAMAMAVLWLPPAEVGGGWW
ncbi:hypothetical protein PAPYR_12275 [Paratrimastix pyriformis]|uniref:Uncharacterized protein n=1 Tax=Paratrimastix pyriformis TaxID=342808 RepID=A0ABQ8U260_9EUKA|nr:hypothetical protein PAPYR_12275 [Paratrimastix pyriformis]